MSVFQPGGRAHAILERLYDGIVGRGDLEAALALSHPHERLSSKVYFTLRALKQAGWVGFNTWDAWSTVEGRRACETLRAGEPVIIAQTSVRVFSGQSAGGAKNLVREAADA